MDGFMLEDKKETVHEEYQFDTISDNISVDVARPKGWGEGMAVELAITILERRYYQLFAKHYTREK